MKTLQESDFIDAAKELGCNVAVIKAVCEVESPNGGFLDDGRPRVLFERHIFSKQTNGRFDKTHPDLSNPRPGGYLGGASENDRLDQAKCLDDQAAVMSASWGKFQLMGFNFALCGFSCVNDFVVAMCESERRQLDAFVEFVKVRKLIPKLEGTQ